LFVWELDLLNELLVVVSRQTHVNWGDMWFWNLTPEGRYSVKLAYSFLLSRMPTLGSPEGAIL